MEGKAATFVRYNDGAHESLYALVVGDHGGGDLDLFVPHSGDVVTGVPHREPSDYAAGGGGGRTWHEA